MRVNNTCHLLLTLSPPPTTPPPIPTTNTDTYTPINSSRHHPWASGEYSESIIVNISSDRCGKMSHIEEAALFSNILPNINGLYLTSKVCEDEYVVITTCVLRFAAFWNWKKRSGSYDYCLFESNSRCQSLLKKQLFLSESEGKVSTSIFI